jgi:NADPH2:quinone reductase
MRSIGYEEFGSAKIVLKAITLNDPIAKEGEVVVKLHASGVNPSDTKARAGSRPGVIKPPFPLVIPHSDGAGEIVSVGKSVPSSRIGERVWVWNGQWKRAYGTASEYITLPQEQAVILPKNTSFEVGATLGIPGLTACHAVLGNGSVAGKTLLISGGSGTVGHIAIQIAKAHGAKVLTTISNPEDEAAVLVAGADNAFLYSDDNLDEQILFKTGGEGVDRIVEVEFGRNIDTNVEIIKNHGTIVSYGSAQDMSPQLPFYPLMFKAVKLELMLVYLLSKSERTQAIEHLTKLLEEGKLKIRIHKIFDLDMCVKAHEAIESGKRSGSVILKI